MYACFNSLKFYSVFSHGQQVYASAILTSPKWSCPRVEFDEFSLLWALFKFVTEDSDASGSFTMELVSHSPVGAQHPSRSVFVFPFADAKLPTNSSLHFTILHVVTLVLTFASEVLGNFIVWSSTPCSEPEVLSVSSLLTIGVAVNVSRGSQVY